ncbi:aminotransferase class V-fold PLP-dependent enzyme [Amycolatopsis plumensis]|uniref:aminotransferase class V-fold PLP-dependent enzyme n=1 Tax=Amycolatopsis plumensis TaxID=236508 RepID=UPI00361FADDD
MTDELPYPELGSEWASLRFQKEEVLHLDTAACGRTSHAVQARVATYLAHEAEVGGYVAEASMASVFKNGRAGLGALIGFTAEDVAFTESASTAFVQLLASWPLEKGDTVWALRSDWGPSLAALIDRGLRVELLDVDSRGVLDVDALERRLRHSRPALLHMTAALSHRAVLQPITECLVACSSREVPVILDVAQAAGQFAVPEGVAAVYGTGRKFLCGPRGVGYLAVSKVWQPALHPRAPALVVEAWPGEDRLVRRLESREAFIGGRAGLAVALGEFHEMGAGRIRARLDAIGRAGRRVLGNVPGWSACDPVGAPGAIISLEVASDYVDLAVVRAKLLRQKVVSR